MDFLWSTPTPRHPSVHGNRQSPWRYMYRDLCITRYSYVPRGVGAGSQQATRTVLCSLFTGVPVDKPLILLYSKSQSPSRDCSTLTLRTEIASCIHSPFQQRMHCMLTGHSPNRDELIIHSLSRGGTLHTGTVVLMFTR